MSFPNVELLISVGTIVFAGGASWAGVKAAFNGMKNDVKEIKDNAKEIREDLRDHEKRITVIETVHTLEEQK
jgi:hypothetical protein